MHKQVTLHQSAGSARMRGSQTRRRSWLPRMAAAAIATTAAPALLAGTATFDFGADPSSDPNITLVTNHDQPWQSEGGNPGGFLAISYPQDSQSTKVLFPDIDQGKLVKAFKFEADLRVGNSEGDRGADGFSVSFIRGSDPILGDATMPDSLFAGGVPEGGGTTGIAISFDTWAGNTLPDTADIEGILVRVDNVTILRQALATRHGACEDATSLQTGPRDPEFWANFGDVRSPESWDTLCWQPISVELDDTGKLTVQWKGQTLLDKQQTTYFPSVGRLLLAGRTGGENEHTHVDNIRITTTLATSPIVGLAQGNGCGFSVTIADAGTVVPTQNTIAMKLNGTAVTPSISKVADITTLTYNLPVGTTLASGSTNLVEVSFTDSAGTANTSVREYVVPAYSTIPASAATTSFTASSSGFAVRVHQLPFGRAGSDANSIGSAEQQLGGDSYNPSNGTLGSNIADLSGTNAQGFYVTETVNWDQLAADVDPATQPDNFNSVEPTDAPVPNEAIPGIPIGAESTDNIAAEILTFLELKRGCNVLGVNSDDGFAVRLGHGATGPILGSFNGGRGAADTTFRIYVEQDGVYPIRLSWWEGGGGGNVEFFSVDANGVRHLVNNRADPLAIKAYSAGRTPGYLASFVPAAGFNGAERRPTIAATFRNDLTSVDTASIRLLVDGQQVTATPQTSGNRVTVSYTPTADYAAGSAHTASVIYTVGGVTQTNTVSFNARPVSPRDAIGGLAIEAEQFDYDSGQSVASVNTMPYENTEYEGLAAVHNVDYFQPESVPDGDIYRSGEDPNVPFSRFQDANTLDLQRPGFDLTANYSIGWVGGNEWYNYTRTIPAGNYKIFGVQSHADSNTTADRRQATFGIVTAGKGTANQTVVTLGSYSAPGTGGWGNNELAVAQTGGRDTVVRLPAGTHTFRVTLGIGDFDWWALAPTTEPASPPSAAITPASGGNRAVAFNAAITDLFRSGTIVQNTIKLTVNNTDVTANATVTKTATGYNVNYRPAAVGPVNYVLTYSDGTTSYTNTGSYNSILTANNFVIEAEDFNHGGGQTVAAASTMPLQSGLYDGLGATHDVDYHVLAEVADSPLYRIGESPNVPMDATQDRDRGAFVLANNYKIGWTDAGEWYNYTRTFPNATYNVYAAISHGDQGPTAGTLSLLNGGATNQLGIFTQPSGTGGWGVNRLVPLTDTNGGMVAVPLNGQQTIRYTIGANGQGAGDFDYLVFVPGGTATTAMRDITSPADAISGFGGTWPAGENPSNVVDNTTTKFLNFGQDPTSAPFVGPVGFVVTPASGATVVKAIRFYTANDAPERDPADFVLEGSNDGTTFTQIASGSLALPTDRNAAGQNPLNGASQTVTVNNSTAYTSYRVTFNNVRNNTTANSMQIGEVDLLGDVSTQPTGPRIAVTRSGSSITLTWTGGGSLEATPALGAGASWQVVDSDGSYTTSTATGNMFFRVRQ